MNSPGASTRSVNDLTQLGQRDESTLSIVAHGTIFFHAVGVTSSSPSNPRNFLGSQGQGIIFQVKYVPGILQPYLSQVCTTHPPSRGVTIIAANCPLLSYAPASLRPNHYYCYSCCTSSVCYHLASAGSTERLMVPTQQRLITFCFREISPPRLVGVWVLLRV